MARMFGMDQSRSASPFSLGGPAQQKLVKPVAQAGGPFSLGAAPPQQTMQRFASGDQDYMQMAPNPEYASWAKSGFDPYAGVGQTRFNADGNPDADFNAANSVGNFASMLGRDQLDALGAPSAYSTVNRGSGGDNVDSSHAENPAFTQWAKDNQMSLSGGYQGGNNTSTLTDPSGKTVASGRAPDDSDTFALQLGMLGGWGGATALAGGFGGGAAGAAPGGTPLGIEGATYAMPGAEGGFSLANLGGAEAGAGGLSAGAVDSAALGVDGAAGFIPGVDSAASGFAGAATAPRSANLGSLGSAVGTGTGLANLASSLKEAGSGAANFLSENPTLGRFAGGVGAGLATQALAGSPPTGPNAAALTQQQNASNLSAAQQQAQLNRVDTTTPFGFQKFGQVADPSVPGGMRYTQEIGLSPEQRQLYDAETSNQIASQGVASGMQGRVAQSVANPLDLSGAGQAEKALSADRFSADRDKVTSALFDRLTRLRKPQMDRDRAALDVQLRNQGLMPGTEAYDNGMRSMLDSQGTEMSNFADQAVTAGGAEQSRLQTDSRANSSLNNNVRNQAISETLLQRQQPLTEYNSFRTGNAPTLPTFQPFGMGSVAPTNTTAAANSQYQSQSDAYNAKIARLQSLLNFGTQVAKP